MIETTKMTADRIVNPRKLRPSDTVRIGNGRGDRSPIARTSITCYPVKADKDAVYPCFVGRKQYIYLCDDDIIIIIGPQRIRIDASWNAKNISRITVMFVLFAGRLYWMHYSVFNRAPMRIVNNR